MKRIFKTALLLTASVFAQFAANAGEMTLYTHDDFKGRPLTVSESTPSLRQFGFNDRASSLIVHSGRWEVCADDDFRGYCAVFERGEYRSLQGFNDRLSSVREIGRGGWHRDRDRDRDQYGGGGAPLELFSTAEFGGRRVALSHDVRTLDDFDFNDKAGSMVINEGEWELCVHADFRGDCMVRGPGRYANMGPYNNQLSSVRRLH